jgi:glutathione synthase/RimK-type ligase-like ATP-grasp enzyme
VIFKSFSATPTTWRETRPVRDVDLGLMDQVRYAPVIFQELVPGGRDIRATVVGDQVFAAEIRADQSAYEFDFRIDSAHAPISEYRLPEPVQERLLALMRRLGLRYGAADFRVAPDGDHVFLEVNPAGQWLFVEYATGQPIAAALADLLARLDRSREGERVGALIA